MHIEYLVTKSSKPKREGGRGLLPPPRLESYLLGLDGKSHNGPATEILCAASMWAYSDLKTFASMMCHRGLYGEFVGINVTNDAALVDTTAYLFLSESRKLAILTCRGTEPTNVINWLADASARLVPQEDGEVHGGFLTASIVLLPAIGHLLLSWARQGRSLADGLLSLNDQCYPDEVFPPEVSWVANKLAKAQQLKALVQPDSENRWSALKERVKKDLEVVELRLADLEKLAKRAAARPSEGEGSEDADPEDASVLGTDELKPGLYICGHSLGGAFAAMAGGMIYSNPGLRPIRNALRSIYTFGAPMFADETLARSRDEEMGDLVYRHRYKDDIVPLLPGRLQGKYKHFGQAYKSSNDGCWTRTLDKEYAVVGTVIANLIGIAAFAKENITILRWLPMPFSWTDHSPLRYMRTSQAPRVGWEILGSELGPDSFR